MLPLLRTNPGGMTMFGVPRRAAALTIAAAAATITLGARSHTMPQSTLRLTSTDFADGAMIPTPHAFDQMHGQNCGGQNISPALQWSGAPSGTMSFALVMHDPDAKLPGGWTHWVIYGMVPTMTGLARDAGKGNGPYVEGKSSFGFGHYGGPCPPVGNAPHHYGFTLYALDLTPTALAPGLDKTAVEAAIKGHTLATAALTGLYQRKQG